jgi:hypothetical protein
MSRTFSISNGSGDSLKVSVLMRLQAERAPNPADRHPAEPGGFGQAARAPMGLSSGRAFQSLNDHLLDLGIAYLARGPGSRLVIQSFQASLQKSRAPLADHA